MLRLLPLLLTALAVGARVSSAETPPSELLVFPAVADTYVSSAAPTTSFGADAQLRADTVPVDVVYLRFVVSGLAGRTVTRARLRLTVTDLSDSGGTVHRISDTTWDEASLAFATRPAVDGPGLATLGPVAIGDVVEFPLDGTVTTDDTYAFAIDTTSTNAVGYRSTAPSATGGPALILTVAEDPTPQLAILAPRDGASAFVGDLVTLRARATDVLGDLGPAVTWSSDVQGPLGTGALVTTSLVAGRHALVATVTNAAGLTAAAAVHVTVTAPGGPNTPPLVTITEPADGQAVPAERAVTFTADADDLEEGDLAGHLSWASDVGGALGTGASVTVVLEPGTHQVTATVTDAAGLAGTAHVTAVVRPPVTLSFTPVADAFADSSKAGGNFGTATQLRAGSKPIRLGYLRFAVNGVGTRPVRQAVLRLRVSPASGSGSDSGGLVRAISNTTWEERTLTYKNRPALDGPVLASLGTVVPGQAIDVPVSPAASGDGAVSFALASTSARPVSYATRETPTPPTLVLTLGNAAPAVTITAPAGGAVVFAGVPVTLAATALDSEDGDLGAVVVWTSNLDGPLGSGANLVVPLRTPGTHTITATATDADGRPGATTITLRARGPNLPPSLSITAPPAGTRIAAGTPLGLAAIASDDFDTALAGRIQWTSSLAGALGTGARLTVRLAEGTHVLTARVTDTDGTPAAATLDVTVTPTPPVVQITAPAAGATLIAAVAATFRATAMDASGSDLSRAVTWASDGDGALGTGATLTTAGLSLGLHRITATVTDRAGLVATAERIVLVEPRPAGSAGVHDFRFGPGIEYGVQKATAEKPESKLWYNDGTWWATLYRPASRGYRIHRLDPATQTWVDTDVLVDERPHSRQDALSLGTTLYLLSRFEATGTTTRLLRYTYVPVLHTYLRDPGFPVLLPGGGTESMTLARDSTGTLWVVYTLGGQVWVNRSLGNDTQWGTPFKLPVAQGTRTALDDIAAVVALPGAIGVFWSNQVTDAFYLAVHPDGAPATAGASWRLEVAAQGGAVADDHFNPKPLADGRLVVVVKTSRTAASATQVGLLVRSAAGSWSPLHPVTTVAFAPTRPQCLVDERSHLVYVFYSSAKAAVYYKASDLDRIAFPTGIGTPLIASRTAKDINNPTTTKQTVSPATGFVVLASDGLDYFHAVR